MFCPNCAAPNDAEQHYCRTCGLKLDAIAADLAEQTPSAEYAVLQRRKRVFEIMGIFSISIAGFIGLSLLITKAFYYKMLLFGPEVLFYSAFAALLLFGLLSVFFFNYPKLFMKFDNLNSRLPASTADNDVSLPTNKLLNDPPFQPASVTEHSTELLSTPRKD